MALLGGTDRWLQAARPRTLPAAVVPVLVGSATAYAQGVFDWRAFALALVGALAIQVAANFANDASDAARGADPEDRIGPARMVASGAIAASRMWQATWAAISVAALCGIGLARLAGPIVLLIGVASVLALLGYVGGPVPYGYRGLGEAFVFVFFGLVATTGSRFVHDRSIDLATWVLAVPVGLMAVAILLINNLRDLETDTRVGKTTLPVMIGDGATRSMFSWVLVLAYGVIALGALFKVISWWTLIAFLTAPLAAIQIQAVRRHDDRRALVPSLGQTARLHLFTGVLIAVGTLVGRTA